MLNMKIRRKEKKYLVKYSFGRYSTSEILNLEIRGKKIIKKSILLQISGVLYNRIQPVDSLSFSQYVSNLPCSKGLQYQFNL